MKPAGARKSPLYGSSRCAVRSQPLGDRFRCNAVEYEGEKFAPLPAEFHARGAAGREVATGDCHKKTVKSARFWPPIRISVNSTLAEQATLLRRVRVARDLEDPMKASGRAKPSNSGMTSSPATPSSPERHHQVRAGRDPRVPTNSWSPASGRVPAPSYHVASCHVPLRGGPSCPTV